LDTLEIAFDSLGESFDGFGFGQSWRTFNQQMASASRAIIKRSTR